MTAHVGRRPTLIAIGLLYLAAAVNLRPPYPFTMLVRALPWMWEGIFGAAAAACIVCAVRRPSSAMRFASFMLVIAASSSRVVALWAVTPHAVPWLPPPNAVGWMIATVMQLAFWLPLVAWGAGPPPRQER